VATVLEKKKMNERGVLTREMLVLMLEGGEVRLAFEKGWRRIL
jgi:hypothetical protein